MVLTCVYVSVITEQRTGSALSGITVCLESKRLAHIPEFSQLLSPPYREGNGCRGHIAHQSPRALRWQSWEGIRNSSPMGRVFASGGPGTSHFT